MFSRVLVPLDGSDRAERALAVAGQVARASHGSVILLRVINDIAESGAVTAMAPMPLADHLERDELEARDYLADIATSEALRGLAVETHIEYGSPAEVMLDGVDAWRADAIVMCSHGRTGLTRWALGSVAQQVVRRAPVPIVLLRERGGLPLKGQSSERRMFRVLIPLDGSELAEAALGPAIAYCALVAPDSFEAHVVRVLPFIRTVARDALREQAAVEAAVYLDRAAKRIAATPGAERARVTTAVVYDLDAAAALARVAEGDLGVVGTAVTDGCDMIAMATHGRTGLARLAMGSVTEGTLSATKLPALIARPRIDERRRASASKELEEIPPEAPDMTTPHPFEALF